MGVVKIERVGDKTVIALDEAALERLGVAAGDALIVSETSEGMLLSPDTEAAREDVIERGRAFVDR